LEVIEASREPGSRDPDETVVPDARTLAAELTDLLLAARPEGDPP